MKLLTLDAPLNLNYSNPNATAQNNLVVGGFQANQSFYNQLTNPEVIQNPTFAGGISPWVQTNVPAKADWQNLSQYTTAVFGVGQTFTEIVSQNVSLSVGETYDLSITIDVVSASLNFIYIIDGTFYNNIYSTGTYTIAFPIVAANANSTMIFEASGTPGDSITVENFSLQNANGSIIADPTTASLFAQESQNEPFGFNFLHIRCNVEAQYYVPYYWVYQSVEGKQTRIPFQISNYVSPFQYQPDVQIEFPKPAIFDGNHWLEISSIGANTQFIMMFDYRPAIAAKYRQPDLLNNPRFPDVRPDTQPNRVQTTFWGFLKEFFK